ncbi:MAG TPA: ATP-dependent zinc protease [Nitrosomonas halophila]|nr:ATP-dependent zinc protease [Nitrosomonas halophila]
MTSLAKRVLSAAMALLLLMMPYGMASAEKTVATPDALKILGWVEFVRLEPWGLKTRARLDTGANTSSMSARDVHVFKKNGKRWARFTFDFKTGKDDRSIEIERPLARLVKIKQHSGPPQERPVVSMDICLADEVRSVEFSLIDRRALNYPILLGRKALAGYALVDSANAYLSKAGCGHEKKKKMKDSDETSQGAAE